MTANMPAASAHSGRRILLNVLILLALLYIFLFSIALFGTAFKLVGKGFSEQLIATTTNPVVGLMIGLLATSLIQSSSSTTSIVVRSVPVGLELDRREAFMHEVCDLWQNVTGCSVHEIVVTAWDGPLPL